MKLVRLLLAIVVLVSLTPVVQGEEGVSVRAGMELALRDYAKVMCSAVFISARDLAEAERNSGPLVTENIGSSYSVFSEADRATAQVHVAKTPPLPGSIKWLCAKQLAKLWDDHLKSETNP